MRVLPAMIAVLLCCQAVLAADLTLAVDSAKAAPDAISGQASVVVSLTPESTKAFGELTSANVGNVVEVRVDGELLTAPMVQTPILGGTLVITGALTKPDATALARRLAEDGAVIELTVIPR